MVKRNTHPYDLSYPRNSRDKVMNIEGELGSPEHGAPITATNSAQAISLSAGKRVIRVTNIGTKDAYYGGAGVSS